MENVSGSGHGWVLRNIFPHSDESRIPLLVFTLYFFDTLMDHLKNLDMGPGVRVRFAAGAGAPLVPPPSRFLPLVSPRRA